MPFSEQSNEILDPAAVTALSEMKSAQGPVLSLYLNGRGSDRIDPADNLNPVGRFDQLLLELAQQKKVDQGSPAFREQWDQEAGRVRRWLEQDQSRQHESLAVFSSLAAGLWQVFRLPAPVTDRLISSDRPVVRPLELLLGEFRCTLVVLIDAGMARLVQVLLGKAEEVDQLEMMPVTGGSQYARDVIERAQTSWQARSCERLIIGGSGEALNELRDALPDMLRAQLAGEVALSPQAELAEILTQVQEIESEDERRVEAQHVEEFIASIENGKEAVTGLEQALLAVRSKKVRLLLAEEGFQQAGGVCPNCGFLSEGEETICLLCGMALRPEPDLIEAALKRVLDLGGKIDVLRSPETRHALEPYGRIGALLYDSQTMVEKELSNQQTLSKAGKIHPDVLHDEAIEESFPASDPPSWTH